MIKRISYGKKEYDILLGDTCVICGRDFTLKHPKDNRCICEKCAAKIAKVIGVEDGRSD